MLTQKVVKGELVIVPDLKYHSCWDFALGLVQPPESILAQRRKQESNIRENCGPFQPGRLLEEAVNGTSLRDLPEPGLGRKLAKIPAENVQGPRKDPCRLTSHEVAPLSLPSPWMEASFPFYR